MYLIKACSIHRLTVYSTNCKIIIHANGGQDLGLSVDHFAECDKCQCVLCA